MEQKLSINNLYDKDFAAWLEWNEQCHKKADLTGRLSAENNHPASYESEVEKKWLMHLHSAHISVGVQTWC